MPSVNKYAYVSIIPFPMRNEDLSGFKYGDQILITYRNNTRNGIIPLPDILQDLGFFVEFDSVYEEIHLARRNPVLMGNLKDLPAKGESIPDMTSEEGGRWSKRFLIIGDVPYSLEDVIYVKKVM